MASRSTGATSATRGSPRGVSEADCVLDCHQDALHHFRSWPGTSPTRASPDSGSGTGLGVARFPFPPHGRIPNFAGAEVAAERFLDIEPWKSATAIKVNLDSPQRPLRAEALRRGILRLGQLPGNVARRT